MIFEMKKISYEILYLVELYNIDIFNYILKIMIFYVVAIFTSGSHY